MSPDMKGVVEGNQGHTYGLSFWLPFQGSGSEFYNTYSIRSVYLAEGRRASKSGGR